VNAAQAAALVSSFYRMRGVVSVDVVGIARVRPRVPRGQHDEATVADDVQEQFQP